MREYELIIIGGGAAGMLAAIEGKKNGIDKILIIEKDPILGGTLNSAGYPINKDKTVIGKEYKETLLDEFEKYDIEVQLNTMVLKIEEKKAEEKPLIWWEIDALVFIHYLWLKRFLH